MKHYYKDDTEAAPPDTGPGSPLVPEETESMELVLVGDRPLATVAAMFTFAGPDALLIDATRVGFVCPLDLAGMLAIAHWAWAAQMSVTLQLPREEGAVSYFQRMDVLRRMPPRTNIVGRIPLETRKDLRHRLLEATPLNKDTADDLAEKVGNLIMAYYPDTVGPVVVRACNELLDNAVDHGASPEGAFLAAQAYTGTTSGNPRLELAVCDTGMGVLKHLRQNPEHQHLATDQHALVEALRDGVTGTADKRGNGLGDLITSGRKHGRIRFHMRSGLGELTVTATATIKDPSVAPRARVDQTPGTWAWLSHDLPQPA